MGSVCFIVTLKVKVRSVYGFMVVLEREREREREMMMDFFYRVTVSYRICTLFLT